MPSSTNTPPRVQITDTQLKDWLSNLHKHTDIATICAIYELVTGFILDDVSKDGDMTKFNVNDN